MATRTITIPMCDLEGCGSTSLVKRCPSCNYEFCFDHMAHLGYPYDVDVCRPCLDFKLDISPKEQRK